jgi:hypothetical protein
MLPALAGPYSAARWKLSGVPPNTLLLNILLACCSEVGGSTTTPYQEQRVERAAAPEHTAGFVAFKPAAAHRLPPLPDHPPAPCRRPHGAEDQLSRVCKCSAAAALCWALMWVQ